MSIFFDAYDRKARLAPAVLASAPAVVLAGAIVGASGFSLAGGAGLATAVLLLVFALSRLVRGAGQRIEARAWERWGGPPTTRLLRWRDGTMSGAMKQQLHDAIARSCGITLMSHDEEARDPAESDRRIQDAVGKIRTLARTGAWGGLWYAHLIDYGFYRNLTGVWPSALLIALATTAAVLGLLLAGKLTALAACMMASIVIIYSAGVITFATRVAPGAMKHSADLYARELFNIFLEKV